MQLSNLSKPGQAPSRANILIVDDLPDNLRILSETLALEGFDVRSAITGEMAMMGISAEAPDLILLDIKMPGMNGFEVCEAIKASDDTASIPIIFLSALDDPSDKVKAFESGGADYIAKPFQISEVLARVNHQLTILHQKQKIESQNTALIESNHRLDQFSAILAHDLKQPIQSIILSIYLLEKKCGSLINQNSYKHIADIRNTSHAMSALIDSLLAYSRANQSSQGWENCNVTDIVQQVLLHLQSTIQSTQAVVHYEPLPTLVIDGNLILQLFQNLISNALKFVSENCQPTITISAQPFVDSAVPTSLNQPADASTRQEPQSWLFCVKDNGLGIPQDQQDVIFEIFHRIEQDKKYPGHGIGLATCQKIVNHHGGNIWVESQPGQGSAFYFTIKPQ